MTLEETLSQAGLTKNEAKVYLALIKLGSATAAEITKHSHVHRVNVYDVLERLREKGLIGTIMQAQKRIYEAANPTQLIQLLKQKEEAIALALPQLEQEFKSKKEKQQVHHFFGTEGVMRAYHMMMEQNETIYGIGGSGLNRKYLQHRHEMFNKERIKRKIGVKAIYYEFTRENKSLNSNEPYSEFRYIPQQI